LTTEVIATLEVAAAMELTRRWTGVVVIAAGAVVYARGGNDFARQRVDEWMGNVDIRIWTTLGGEHEYPTCIQRPDYRRIDGRYDASKSVDGPIESAKRVYTKECNTKYEYDPAQASPLAS
jgi:hypothetical protein